MSLLKQLLLSASLAMVVIVAGTLAFSVDSARTYLSEQVQSESDNAALTLAITLSQHENQDPVMRELLLMALYDTGRFQQVQFTESTGEVTFDRRRDGAVKRGKVPVWFARILPLPVPTSVREVSDGWKQVGHLTVVGDNSYAYQSLLNSGLRQLGVVVAAGALWAILILMLVRWLRRALNEHVARHVRAIVESEEVPLDSPAPVSELASLVDEISHVRRLVSANVNELDAQIESLKLELNQDAVTGLANRKYFMNELSRVLKDQSTAGGHVMLLRIRDMVGISEAHSCADVDVWLRGCAAEMQRLSAALGDACHVARLNGSDFAILMPDTSGPKAMQAAQEVCRRLLSMPLDLADGSLSRWAFSLTDYEPGQEAGSVMGMLDHGLIRAESAGHTDVEYAPREVGAVMRVGASEGEWRNLLRNALDHHDLHLELTDHEYQGPTPVLRADASLQMTHDQDVLPGSLFMPIAARVNLSWEFDLRAIALAMDWIGEHQRDIVVRVSMASLQQARFWTVLNDRLEQLRMNPEVASHLVFEIDAHGLMVSPDHVVRFCAEAQAVGARVGLRRLDAEPGALSRLHLPKINYVRLTGPLVFDLLEGVGNYELLRAIQATTQRLGLEVFADTPRNEISWKFLVQHGVQVALS